jgi:hypothetical protein
MSLHAMDRVSTRLYARWDAARWPPTPPGAGARLGIASWAGVGLARAIRHGTAMRERGTYVVHHDGLAWMLNRLTGANKGGQGRVTLHVITVREAKPGDGEGKAWGPAAERLGLLAADVDGFERLCARRAAEHVGAVAARDGGVA